MGRRALPTLILPLLFLAPAGASAQVAVTLPFEEACLDLDTGTVETGACRSASSDAAWDVVVALHADRAVRSVIFQNRLGGVEIAHLVGVTFAEVTADAVAMAEFTTGVIDLPFDATRVLLVRTDLGAVYKLGDPSEGEGGLTFVYERL